MRGTRINIKQLRVQYLKHKKDLQLFNAIRVKGYSRLKPSSRVLAYWFDLMEGKVGLYKSQS